MFFEARRFMERISKRQETSVSKSAQGWARYMPPRPISGGQEQNEGNIEQTLAKNRQEQAKP